MKAGTPLSSSSMTRPVYSDLHVVGAKRGVKQDDVVIAMLQQIALLEGGHPAHNKLLGVLQLTIACWLSAVICLSKAGVLLAAAG